MLQTRWLLHWGQLSNSIKLSILPGWPGSHWPWQHQTLLVKVFRLHSTTNSSKGAAHKRYVMCLLEHHHMQED